MKTNYIYVKYFRALCQQNLINVQFFLYKTVYIKKYWALSYQDTRDTVWVQGDCTTCSPILAGPATEIDNVTSMV